MGAPLATGRRFRADSSLRLQHAVNNMIKVKATREGLVGQRTASGYLIDTVVPFVALLSSQVKRRRKLLVFWAVWMLVMHSELVHGPGFFSQSGSSLVTRYCSIL